MINKVFCQHGAAAPHCNNTWVLEPLHAQSGVKNAFKAFSNLYNKHFTQNQTLNGMLEYLKMTKISNENE